MVSDSECSDDSCVVIEPNENVKEKSSTEDGKSSEHHYKSVTEKKKSAVMDENQMSAPEQNEDYAHSDGELDRFPIESFFHVQERLGSFVEWSDLRDVSCLNPDRWDDALLFWQSWLKELMKGREMDKFTHVAGPNLIAQVICKATPETIRMCAGLLVSYLMLPPAEPTYSLNLGPLCDLPGFGHPVKQKRINRFVKCLGRSTPGFFGDDFSLADFFDLDPGNWIVNNGLVRLGNQSLPTFAEDVVPHFTALMILLKEDSDSE